MGLFIDHRLLSAGYTRLLLSRTHGPRYPFLQWPAIIIARLDRPITALASFARLRVCFVLYLFRRLQKPANVNRPRLSFPIETEKNDLGR